MQRNRASLTGSVLSWHHPSHFKSLSGDPPCSLDCIHHFEYAKNATNRTNVRLTRWAILALPLSEYTISVCYAKGCHFPGCHFAGAVSLELSFDAASTPQEERALPVGHSRQACSLFSLAELILCNPLQRMMWTAMPTIAMKFPFSAGFVSRGLSGRECRWAEVPRPVLARRRQ
jgi:hypothetical protein